MDYRKTTAEELIGPLNEVESKNAPSELYVAGNTDLLAEGGRVSIVGSRRASSEGLSRARKLARILVNHEIVVVSGLADGIDTAAHTATIESGGSTIAVLGTSLDKAYPKQNAPLQDIIIRDHLCVSQFAVGKQPGKRSFPMRNRTMALLSDATVIIEASDSSGSLHQGWEALRLGRLLYIANAVVQDESLTWPQKMLHYGASVLTDDSVKRLLHSLPPRGTALVHDELSL